MRLKCNMTDIPEFLNSLRSVREQVMFPDRTLPREQAETHIKARRSGERENGMHTVPKRGGGRRRNPSLVLTIGKDRLN